MISLKVFSKNQFFTKLSSKTFINVTNKKYLQCSTIDFCQKSSIIENNNNKKSLNELNSEEINKRILSSFFDFQENWSKEEIKSGRAWRLEELRIKSNQDLHKLWYILLKERNMLMTMEQAAKDQVDNMPSPERLDKIELAMKNLEQVIKERNHAYWQLEIGDSFAKVERPKFFRRDLFGRWRWIAASEHLIPYYLNLEWRKVNAPGFGQDVVQFNRKLNEIRLNKKMSTLLKQQFYCRQLMKRFPNLDLEYLQEKFPDLNIKHLKDNLNEYTLQNRQQRFHLIFYHKRQNI